MISIFDWHARFNEQLNWTKDLRDYIYNKLDIVANSDKFLEIGCGTGELLKEIGLRFQVDLFGVDINEKMIKIAKKNLKISTVNAKLLHIDFLKNNFENNSFDIIATHYFFLWVKNLEKCFQEIYRILKKKGTLLIFAEPDYGGLIEYPNTYLKDALSENLKKEGADPEVGRKLSQHFSEKFEIVERFCTSIPWISSVNREDLKKELKFFIRILNNTEFNSNLLRENIESDNYFIFLPVFSYYLKKI